MKKLENNGYIFPKYIKKRNGGSFFIGKKYFVIKDSNDLPATPDNISSSFPDETFKAKKLAVNTCPTLIE